MEGVERYETGDRGSVDETPERYDTMMGGFGFRGTAVGEEGGADVLGSKGVGRPHNWGEEDGKYGAGRLDVSAGKGHERLLRFGWLLPCWWTRSSLTEASCRRGGCCCSH